MKYTEYYKEQQEELAETTKAIEDLNKVENATNEDGQDFIDSYLKGDVKK